MESSTKAREHRWGERMRVNAPVQVRIDEDIIVGVSVRDASLSGAFLLMAVDLPEMSRIWLRHARGSGNWLPAYVARSDRDGLGIQWCEPGDKTLNHLLALRRPTHAAPPPPTFEALPDRYAVNMRGLPASMM
jgi:hypothetical protein